MSSSGDVILAWPGDHVVTGDQLQELADMLEPRRKEVARLLGATGLGEDTHARYVAEASALCNAVVLDVIDFFPSPITRRAITAIVEDCWDHTEVDSGVTERVTNKESLLSIALSNLEGRKVIKLDAHYRASRVF